MPRVPSRADPEAAVLFDWYEGVRARFDDIAPGDLFASWHHVLTPVLLPLGEAPMDDELVAHPNRFFQDGTGDWYVKPPLAQAEPGLNGVVVVTVDGAGLAVLVGSQVTYDREDGRGLLPRGDDPSAASLRQFVAELLPSGVPDGVSPQTGKGWRKRYNNALIARALVAEGWRRLGYQDEPAVRALLCFEHELGGSYGNAIAYEALKGGHPAIWRDRAKVLITTNRRVLTALRANLSPRTDPQGPHAAGHDPVRPGRT